MKSRCTPKLVCTGLNLMFPIGCIGSNMQQLCTIKPCLSDSPPPGRAALSLRTQWVGVEPFANRTWPRCESKVNMRLILTCKTHSEKSWHSKKSQSVQDYPRSSHFGSKSQKMAAPQSALLYGRSEQTPCCSQHRSPGHGPLRTSVTPVTLLGELSQPRSDHPRGSTCSEGIGSHGHSASRHIQASAPKKWWVTGCFWGEGIPDAVVIERYNPKWLCFRRFMVNSCFWSKNHTVLRISDLICVHWLGSCKANPAEQTQTKNLHKTTLSEKPDHLAMAQTLHAIAESSWNAADILVEQVWRWLSKRQGDN